VWRSARLCSRSCILDNYDGGGYSLIEPYAAIEMGSKTLKSEKANHPAAAAEPDWSAYEATLGEQSPGTSINSPQKADAAVRVKTLSQRRGFEFNGQSVKSLGQQLRMQREAYASATAPMAQQAKLSRNAAATRLQNIGVLPEFIDEQGNLVTVVGSDSTEIRMIQSHSGIQTSQHNATSLWPTPLENTPGPSQVNGSSGGYQIGLWDSGSPLITHLDFAPFTGTAPRVTFVGLGAITAHSTEVAGVLIGRGAYQVTNPADNTLGFAYKGAIEARAFYTPLVDLAGLPLMKFRTTNHSYGIIQGWSTIQLVTTNYNTAWWSGNLIGTWVDADFGSYNGDSVSVDATVSNLPY
jgi:hypothetical protein